MLPEIGVRSSLVANMSHVGKSQVSDFVVFTECRKNIPKDSQWDWCMYLHETYMKPSKKLPKCRVSTDHAVSAWDMIYRFIMINMGVSKNNGTPQIIHFNRVFHYKPSILGIPLFFGNTHIVKYHFIGWFGNQTHPAGLAAHLGYLSG